MTESSLYDFLFSAGSVIYGGKACDACNVEDELERSDIHPNPSCRKKNSKRKRGTFTGDGVKLIRKRIESAFIVIKRRFPAHVHAVASQGFELKISRSGGRHLAIFT